MNNCTFIGRLTRDPEVRVANGANGEMKIARFSIAVDRIGAKEKTADFVPCVAFGTTADTIEKHFFKGRRIAVQASFRSGSYKDKDNKPVYTSEFWVERFDFIDNNPNAQNGQQQPGYGQGYQQSNGYAQSQPNGGYQNGYAQGIQPNGQGQNSYGQSQQSGGYQPGYGQGGQQPNGQFAQPQGGYQQQNSNQQGGYSNGYQNGYGQPTQPNSQQQNAFGGTDEGLPFN